MSNPEPVVVCVVDEHIRRLNIANLSGRADGHGLVPFCRADGEPQEASQIGQLSMVAFKNPNQGFTTRVRVYEDRPPFVTSERNRIGCPREIELGCERVCVFKPPENRRRQLSRGGCHCQNRR